MVFAAGALENPTLKLRVIWGPESLGSIITVPLNFVPSGKVTAVAVASVASAAAACAVPLEASTAPAAAVPEYPSSDRLESSDKVPSSLSCTPPPEAAT